MMFKSLFLSLEACLDLSHLSLYIWDLHSLSLSRMIDVLNAYLHSSTDFDVCGLIKLQNSNNLIIDAKLVLNTILTFVEHNNGGD